MIPFHILCSEASYYRTCFKNQKEKHSTNNEPFFKHWGEYLYLYDPGLEEPLVVRARALEQRARVCISTFPLN